MVSPTYLYGVRNESERCQLRVRKLCDDWRIDTVCFLFRNIGPTFHRSDRTFALICVRAVAKYWRLPYVLNTKPMQLLRCDALTGYFTHQTLHPSGQSPTDCFACQV